MSGVNKVILLGRLGKDPDCRQLDNGTLVANFSVATSESYKDKTSGEKKEVTEWHNIQAWKGLAEIVQKFCKKGDQVYIEGKLKTRSWEKDGVTRYITEVIADTIQLLGNGQKSNPPSVSTTQFGEPIKQTTDEDPMPF